MHAAKLIRPEPTFDEAAELGRFWEECYDELLERYPEQFVAADPDSGEVILAESSLAVLVDRLRERSLDPRTDVAIEFITAQRRNLLV